jgi:hypothetical protein
VLVALVGIWVAGAVLTSPGRDARPPEPTFTDFLAELEQAELQNVVLHTRDTSARVTPADGPRYEVGYPPEYAGDLVEQLRSAEVPFDVKPGGSSVLARILRLAVFLVGESAQIQWCQLPSRVKVSWPHFDACCASGSTSKTRVDQALHGRA